MDQLRKEARRVLQQTPWNRPTTLESASTRLTLAQLWTDVSSHENSSHLDVRSLFHNIDQKMHENVQNFRQ